MLKHFVRSPRPLVAASFVFILMLTSLSATARAQTAPPNYDAERLRAIALVNNGKFDEALPLFEKLAIANPTDSQVIYGLGVATLVTSQRIKDDEARRQARLRARATLLRARELGVLDQNLENAISSILPDGGERGVSKNKEANRFMREATAPFQQQNYDEAAKLYERAARLDPTLYEAALYTGNSFYAKKDWDKAGEWFARAIAIDADRETAHRYWGDALMLQGKQEEARAKFFDAIIAEPYGQLAWKGLIQWANRNAVKLAHPRIQPPNSTRGEGNNTTLTLDPGSLNSMDGSNHWLMYDLTRVAWTRGEFLKQYPSERTYRLSLREEAAALRMVAEAASKDVKSGKIKVLNPMLADLVRLNDAGLLEAYVLLGRADAGIMRDYADYRVSNRDKLKRYLTEHVASGKN
ncbi:MAG: tetratricopeptide repeat protein [Pyrinomonadaceae bacterium]